jgi:hypothetical protein
VRVTIYQHRRGSITQADAVGQLEREPAIRGGLAGPNAEFLLQGLNDNLTFPKVTGQALADSDDVPARRLDGEKRVKTGDAIDVIQGHLKGLSQLQHNLLRQTAESGLRFLKRYKQVFRSFIPGSNFLAHPTLRLADECLSLDE